MNIDKIFPKDVIFVISTFFESRYIIPTEFELYFCVKNDEKILK